MSLLKSLAIETIGLFLHPPNNPFQL